MKSLIAFLSIWLHSAACASNFTVAWEDTNITGTVTYKIYAQREGGIFELRVAGLLTKEFTFEEVAPGSISMYVKAVSVDGIESFPSNMITTIIPSAPNNLHIRMRVALQSSADMQQWETVATYEVPESDRQFYRIAFTP